MSTDFEEIGKSIANEQKQIEELMNERNVKYQQCMDDYLNHLKAEIQQLDSTEEQNKQRNVMISQTFENVYQRIMMSSQVTLRKIKETCYEKKQFWNKLIENNASMPDIQLKKSFYQEKRDAEDRYIQAIDNQKIKKVPYSALLGKFKQKQNLREWQVKNKKLEEKVAKGTKTLNDWNLKNPVEERFRSDSDNYQIIQEFTQQKPQNEGFIRQEDGFLNHFQIRKN